jgi:hypothetical protein
VTITHVPAFEARASDTLEDLALAHSNGDDVMSEVRRLAHPSLTVPEVWEAWEEFVLRAGERDGLQAPATIHWVEKYDLDDLEGYVGSHQEAAWIRKAEEADEAQRALRLGHTSIGGN